MVAPAFAPDGIGGSWSQVFLCVKAHHTEEATRALAPHLARDGYVLSLQNGLCEDIIAGIVGPKRTVGAFINFGADWHGPGQILYGNRGAFVIGELDGQITDRLRRTHRTITEGFEPDAIVSESVQSYLWGKLGYGSFLFAQALGQLGIADCLARPELLPLWRRLGAEVNAVAARLQIDPKGFNGYDPKAFTPEASESDAKCSVEAMVAFNRPNAKTHSGVWRDLAVRKRRTEIDVQILPMVQIGEAHGLQSPTARRLVEMIHEIEDGKRPMTDDNLLELMPAQKRSERKD